MNSARSMRATLLSRWADRRGRFAYFAERIGAELDFAEYLASNAPTDRAGEWRRLIVRAIRLIDEVPMSLDEWERAVGRAESLLQTMHVQAKTYTIYCVGHAHIDMNWMWSWPETVSVTIDTTTTVLALAERYPEFRFSQSQASVYRILERYRPDLLDRIRTLVSDGRWEVTASHWVECDKNIVSGESLCRHLLYTRRYIHELFGLTPEATPIDWSPDTFGHAETVPTYLSRGGVKYLYLHRPGAHGVQPVPRAFRWLGPDGSSVLVRNDMHLGYNGVVGPEMVERSLIPTAEELGLPYSLFVYGVGDHGGGPTLRDIERILDMRCWPVFPDIRFSTALEYFNRLECDAASLPKRSGELNFEFTGCYTTAGLIKRSNRLAEAALVRTEQSACFASYATGQFYRHDLLESAWRNTLFGHFHDILPGSGVRATRTHAHGLFQETAAATQSLETHALRTIAAAVDTMLVADSTEPLDRGPGYDRFRGFGGGVGIASGEGAVSGYGAATGTRYPFVLFNRAGADYSGTVEATIWDPGNGWDDRTPEDFEFLFDNGERATAQIIDHGDYWGHRYVRLGFPASIPAWGYTCCVITAVEPRRSDARETTPAGARQTGATHVCSYASYERGREGLENEILLIDIDPARGYPARLFHKASGIVVDMEGDGLEFAVERAGIMSAWKIHHFRERQRPLPTALRRVADGPYLAAIECDYEISASSFTVRYELRAGDPLLHISIRGAWYERGDSRVGTPTLRYGVRPGSTRLSATFEEPFGAIDRDYPDGEEVPAYRWAAVRGEFEGRNGACVLYNDSKHGHAIENGALYLTLIRSSYEPDPFPEIGEHTIRLALEVVPLGAQDPPAWDAVIRRAELFTTPVAVIGTDVHRGRLPRTGRMFTIERIDGKPAPVVSAIKLAESGDAIIIRCYNPDGRPAAAKFTISELLGAEPEVVEVDLLERELSDRRVDVDGATVTLRLGPRDIRSYRLNLRSNR